MPTPNITISDLLTPEELIQVVAIKELLPAGQFAREVCEKVIQPNIERISKTCGQEMDAMYVSYMIQHAISR